MNDKEILKKAEKYFKDTYSLCNSCEWFDIDGDCDIKYMTGNTRYYWTLLCCGLKETALKNEKGIVERSSLRKNTKNYFKLFYKNDCLVKVENNIEGRLSGYFLCFYKDNLRILKPFDTDKICRWLHYGIVTRFSESGVINEVWIDENGQIIYSEYAYNDDSVEFETANCLPEATQDKIQYFERGKFYDNGTKYKRTE